MTTIARTLTYAVALAALAAPSSTGPKQPLSLTLAMPKQPYKAGQPVILLATIANTSAGTVPISAVGGGADVGIMYRIHVLDAQGRVVPRRPSPPKGRIWVGSVGVAWLKPGRQRKDPVNVSYLYDLSQPGKYEVWIAKPYYRGPGRPDGLVKSNTVTVTVVR